MNYTRQQFFNLMEAVEDQGGVHLDKSCVANSYTFKQSRAEERANGGWKFVAQGKPKVVTLPTCGKSALFEVPYLDDPGQRVEVCAVEDSMGLWPRFADQVGG